MRLHLKRKADKSVSADKQSSSTSSSKSSTTSILSHLAGDTKNIPLTKKGIAGTRVRTKTVFAMYTLVGAENVQLQSRKLRKTAWLSPHFDDLTSNPMMVGTHNLFRREDAEKIQQAFISKAITRPDQMILALHDNPEAARQIIKYNPEFITQLMVLNNDWLASQADTLQATFDHVLSKTMKQDGDLAFVGKHNNFLRKHGLKELAKLSYNKEPTLLFTKLSSAFNGIEAESENYVDLQDGVFKSNMKNVNTSAYSELLDLQNLDPARHLSGHVELGRARNRDSKLQLPKELKKLQTINPALYQELKELVATFQAQQHIAIKTGKDLDILSCGGDLLSNPSSSSDSFHTAKSKFDGSSDTIQTVKNEEVSYSPVFSDEVIQNKQEEILNAPDLKFKAKLAGAHIKQSIKNAKHLTFKAPLVAFGAFIGSWGGTIALGQGVKSIFASNKTLSVLKSAKEKMSNLASSSKNTSSKWSEVTPPKHKDYDEQKAAQYKQKVAAFEAKGGSNYLELDQARFINSQKDMEDLYPEVSMSDVSAEDVPVIESGIAERMQKLQAAASSINISLAAKAAESQPAISSVNIAQKTQQLQRAANQLDDTLSLASVLTHAKTGIINENEELEMRQANLRRLLGE
jgi:hypothetical protein